MSDLDSEDGVVKKMAKWKLYTIMLFMLAFVTYNTLIAKAMDEFEVGEVYDHDKKKTCPQKVFSSFCLGSFDVFRRIYLTFRIFHKIGISNCEKTRFERNRKKEN